jgi:hypothetical protein
VIEPASRRHAELIRVLAFDQLSREQIGFLTKVTGLLLAGLEERALIQKDWRRPGLSFACIVDVKSLIRRGYSCT